jgi:predicted N-acetyltransferase YhbS
MQIRLEYKLSPPGVLDSAWEDEPLSAKLPELDITMTMPPPDHDISLLAKNHNGDIIGHCMATRTFKIWQYLDNVDDSKLNASTRTLIAIHKKSVKDEQAHLRLLDTEQENSMHSAGIAVLPEYRGKRVGEMLRTAQIQMCHEQKATTLFCMTTNYFSALNVKKTGFTQIAEYPYKDLAVELQCDELDTLAGAFAVWCRKI